jgi:hypothetical protein
MTEAEWLAATDPTPMLAFLQTVATDRKLRLFGCACSRQVWDLLTEECFRDAIRVGERFADGQASRKELAAVKAMSGAALEKNGLVGVTGPSYCAIGSAWSCTRSPHAAAMYPLWVFTNHAERIGQVGLVRDIFGNPLRPVTLDPTWLTSTVLTLAEGIYADRAFDHLPILADALQDAGCDNADVLAHCREPGPHVRGCWVVDLVLGKQ